MKMKTQYTKTTGFRKSSIKREVYGDTHVHLKIRNLT